MERYRTGLNLLSNISVSETIDAERRKEPAVAVKALEDEKEPVVFEPEDVEKTKPFVLGQKAIDGKSKKKLRWNGLAWEEIL